MLLKDRVSGMKYTHLYVSVALIAASLGPARAAGVTTITGRPDRSA